MNVQQFVEQLQSINVGFYAGVPDSLLKPFCNYLMDKFRLWHNHFITANEGNAVAMAAGYHLATGKVPCVYLQNSGLGNIVNPVTSLLTGEVYGIPCVFVIGWRGEPGVKDEPQHIYQGKTTLGLLELLNIPYFVVHDSTTVDELAKQTDKFKPILDSGSSVALVIKKGALTNPQKIQYKNQHQLLREDVIRHIVAVANEDIVVSTTGKTSRELFELREQGMQSHGYDFLTVGSMGHCSSIALGIAIEKPNTRVWCIDGDGAALMHMGAMAVIGNVAPANYIHVLINNESHESVGGMPTVGGQIDFCQIARGCGYKQIYAVRATSELTHVLKHVKGVEGPVFVEVKTAIGARSDLGRPTVTPIENKKAFMAFLRECK